MNSWIDHMRAMDIAYVIFDASMNITEISESATDILRLRLGDSLKDFSIQCVDEEYNPFSFHTMLKRSVVHDTEQTWELGINYPDKNIEWVRTQVIHYKHQYLLHFTSIAELIATRRLNKQLSTLDPHTGLLYREAFLAKVSQQSEPGIMCCVRIFNYQRINEIWGIAVANLVFMEILARVYMELEQALCCKHSNDSFNVFVPANQSLDIETFYAKLNEPFHFNGNQFFSNVALGYYQEKGADVREQSLNKAEMAILDTLSQRVRLAEFHEDMAKQIEHQNTLETEFRSALHQDELAASFMTLLQPIHEAQSKRVIGAECLIRWRLHDQWVSPVEFIPIAEKLGEIEQLTRFNVSRLSRVVKTLEKQGIDTLKMVFALNISVVEILNVDFVDEIQQEINKVGLSPAQIKLELTESALIDNFNYVNQVLEQLQTLGFRISIDDFGTGFSSLSYLCRLSFDEIKIDRAFVAEVVNDSRLQTVFNSIVSLALNLNKPVVAEGVETREQLAYARAKKVDCIQGFYFSKPLTEDDFIAYVLQHQMD
ncbi:GGDEF domain-containing protein [Vibrio sp. 05-20-BW147]|uniref:bifunctional diguanylate cyclase/phosphodiesterase n=1 Tax=Vibrio sp. 05-20-BW147 TaxID=2575834 RepID=UPI001593C822|nr:bifunctional diguanylate cyclase/phosphodiesterase [Vibrio sp. 05-20-BW147]NVC61815.1 GGDEF domain-containing protein [Vibrio sp. 05-20-BW147]